MPFFGKCGCSSKRIEFEETNCLNYAHSNLTSVPEEVILHERTLEDLNIDANRISELPRWLFQCHGLRSLSLSDNEFNNLSPAIANLVNLENLNISKNGINELPENIKCCKRLAVIEASVNPIGRLPDGFMMLINLRELYLNDTFLEYLPGSFGRLCKLKVLEVRENRLKTLPKSLIRLTELERLDLGTNEFDVFPDVICQIPSLLEIWMDNNKIEFLPDEISNLANLMFLDLSKNCLKYLPNDLSKCSNISDLYLSDNQIDQLPESIGSLSSLTILKLDSNQLVKIPFSIGGLTSLSELVLSNNRLKEIPPSIGLLRNLRTLNLDENHLRDLPADIGSCTGITLFSLRGNDLSYLPEEIGRISRLRVLNLSSNRLKHLPCTLSKLKGLQALWLAENQTKPLIPLQQDKDQYGKRILTCYLFPQEHIRNNFDRQIMEHKQMVENNDYDVDFDDDDDGDGEYDDKNDEDDDDENSCEYGERQQLIRFMGDNTTSQKSAFVKPYPKEAKNTVHHRRNLVIYELNTINNETNGSSTDTENDRRNKVFAYDESDNGQHRTQSKMENHRIDSNSDDFQYTQSSKDSRSEAYYQDDKRTPYLSSPEAFAHSSYLTYSPATKLNHQQLISKIHYDKVQDLLQQNANRSLSQTNPYLNHQQPASPLAQYEFPSKLNEHVITKNSYLNQSNTRDDFLSPKPNAFDDLQQLKLQQTLEDCQRKLQQLELHQTPQQHKKLNFNSSIMTTASANVSCSSPKNSSRQANIVITNSGNKVANGLLRTINVPATPLKVNISEIILNGTSSKNTTIQDGPSSQVSSDSGYSGGATLLQSSSDTSKESIDTNLNSCVYTSNDGHTSMPYSATFSYLNVKIAKNPGLGFSITGGKGFIGNPFKENDPGIFVTKIQENGPAYNILQPGDQILNVNGEDLTNVEHEKAVQLLKSCNKIANLIVKRY